jgi:hypothetical protein
MRTVKYCLEQGRVQGRLNHPYDWILHPKTRGNQRLIRDWKAISLVVGDCLVGFVDAALRG